MLLNNKVFIFFICNYNLNLIFTYFLYFIFKYKIYNILIILIIIIISILKKYIYHTEIILINKKNDYLYKILFKSLLTAIFPIFSHKFSLSS